MIYLKSCFERNRNILSEVMAGEQLGRGTDEIKINHNNSYKSSIDEGFMSRDDCETGRTLITPHIEIGLGAEPSPIGMAYVNVETFRECLGRLTPPSSTRGPCIPGYPAFSIYAVVGRPVPSVDGQSYLNIGEPALSRTLMGYIERGILAEKLPNTYKTLAETEKRKRLEHEVLLRAREADEAGSDIGSDIPF